MVNFSTAPDESQEFVVFFQKVLRKINDNFISNLYDAQ